MKYQNILFLFSLASVALLGSTVQAQEQPGAEPPTEPSAEANAIDELRAQIAVQNARLAEQQAEIERLKSRDESLSALETRVDQNVKSIEEMQMEDFDPDAIEAGFARKLDIYGFFDVTFSKQFVEKNNYANAVVDDESTFLTNRINVYLASTLTETLQALIELRFTFLPHGYEESFTIAGSNVGYERVDTTVKDPFTNEVFQVGGVVIERAHLTWQPFDWFGITAGRYLTPFGIWNIDHGSPILIPIRPPAIQIRPVIAHAQTGLLVFGRFNPARRLYLDYGLTASNGRGPTEAVYDIDENKAVGGRFHANFDGDNLKIGGGGYVYYGQSSDVTKAVKDMNPFQLSETRLLSYDEFTVAADLLVELFGVRLQGELLHGAVLYDTRPALGVEELFDYPSDFTRLMMYGLIAYDLPLSKWTETVITPYVMLERNVENDSYGIKAHVYAAGLNVKPSPFVVLKLEGNATVNPELSTTDFGTDQFGVKRSNRYWGLAAQAAVSF